MDSHNRIIICFLCNNKLDYKIYVRCHTYTQNLIEKSNLVSSTIDNQEYKFAHVKCIALFLELDVYTRTKTNENVQLQQQSDCKVLDIVFENIKNIQKDCYIEDCMICEKNPGKQCLLHCIIK